jgi:tRNA(Ile)-lysidine synthase
MKAVVDDIKKYSHSKALPIISRIASVIHGHALLKAGDKVVVAVSGGSDSLALLHILKELDLELQLLAVYIDHGLRPLETPHEQLLIEEHCRVLGVPFLSQTIYVQELVSQEKRSLEEAARTLRYAALEEIRQEHGAGVIAVGHTADDQVEEFFLRLVRGSSKKGLSGMHMRRDRIIRPLLLETKGALVDYLNDLGISWCQDSSNLHRHFLRNRVRLDLVPLLEKDFNPAIRRTVLHTMDMLAEEESFLEEQTLAAFSQLVTIGDKLINGARQLELAIDIALVERHMAIRRRILEKCCWHIATRPTFRQISKLVDFLQHGETGGELHLEDGVRAEKQNSCLLLYRPLAEGRKRGSRLFSQTIHLPIPGPGYYPVPEANKELILLETTVTDYRKTEERQLFLARERIAFPLLLRTALPGERFFPCNGVGRKKISRFFNDLKIPAKERPSWPVLVSGAAIVALPGLQIDHDYRITEETAVVLAVSWRERHP